MLTAIFFTGAIAGPVNAASTAPGVKLEYQPLNCVRGYLHHAAVSGHGRDVLESTASIEAKSDWRANTIRRYGAAFANLSKARDRSIKCEAGHKKLISCLVIARPCAAQTLSPEAR
jgi:hypothetical protein